MKRVVVVGSGFGGVNAARNLSRNRQLEIILIDRKNYYPFTPLLYQVAMSVLDPADIAIPIRTLFSRRPNVFVLKEIVNSVDLGNKKIITGSNEISYDYLIMACGSRHFYFGRDEWEQYAPGLKTLEQAMEIRSRILDAFEEAENRKDENVKKKLMTFVVVGGGPTGVELAGSIAEMSRIILSKDFRNIDPKKAKVILIEAQPRILGNFSPEMSKRAALYLKLLGVDVRVSQKVTKVDGNGVETENEKIESSTVLWAAGIQASSLNNTLESALLDKQGRVFVEPDLSIKGHPEVFVVGDQANCLDAKTGKPLPGVAPVAMQQGSFAARNILREVNGRPRMNFKYQNPGNALTVGKSKAIVEKNGFKISGFFGWISWLIIHIFFLTGFEKRALVLVQWAWAYMFHYHGARIILDKSWEFYAGK